MAALSEELAEEQAEARRAKHERDREHNARLEEERGKFASMYEELQERKLRLREEKTRGADAEKALMGKRLDVVRQSESHEEQLQGEFAERRRTAVAKGPAGEVRSELEARAAAVQRQEQAMKEARAEIEATNKAVARAHAEELTCEDRTRTEEATSQETERLLEQLARDTAEMRPRLVLENEELAELRGRAEAVEQHLSKAHKAQASPAEAEAQAFERGRRSEDADLQVLSQLKEQVDEAHAELNELHYELARSGVALPPSPASPGVLGSPLVGHGDLSGVTASPQGLPVSSPLAGHGGLSGVPASPLGSPLAGHGDLSGVPASPQGLPVSSPLAGHGGLSWVPASSLMGSPLAGHGDLSGVPASPQGLPISSPLAGHGGRSWESASPQGLPSSPQGLPSQGPAWTLPEGSWAVAAAARPGPEHEEALQLQAELAHLEQACDALRQEAVAAEAHSEHAASELEDLGRHQQGEPLVSHYLSSTCFLQKLRIMRHVQLAASSRQVMP